MDCSKQSRHSACDYYNDGDGPRRSAAANSRRERMMLAPFDSPRAVRSFIAHFRPDVLLITETEIWPNYFLEAARFGARIAVVTAGCPSDRCADICSRGAFSKTHLAAQI